MPAPKLYIAGREGFRPGTGTVGVSFDKAAVDAAVTHWIYRRMTVDEAVSLVRARGFAVQFLLTVRGCAPYPRPMLGAGVLQGEARAVIKRALRRAAAVTARE